MVLIVVWCLASLLLTVSCYAQEAEAQEEPVAEVAVVGNRTVSETVILSKLSTKPGSPFSQPEIDKDIKTLFELGFFKNVSVDVEKGSQGTVVRFIVAERPSIKEIVIEGCQRNIAKKVRSLLTIKEGEILEEKKLAQDLIKVSEYYEKKGFELFEVTHAVKEDPITGKAIVVITVTEGDKVRLDKVVFQGNTFFSSKQLLKCMKTRPRGLLSRGIFKEDNFEIDLDRIVECYRNKGYADARVKNIDKQYSDDKKKLFITIDIEEGDQYHLGLISVKGMTVFTEAQLLAVCACKKDDLFVASKLRKDVAAMRDLYAEKGYIDLQLRVNSMYNKETNAIDVEYDIVENQVSYLNRIDIVGNTRTKDIVIRRELAVSPGELFDTVKVRRSRERLENLGFFKRVEASVIPTDDEARKDLIIEVEEKKTNDLGFGVGYSSIDEFIGFVEVAMNNFDYKNFPYFTGDGQKLRVRAELGKKRRDYILSFTEPWFLERKLSFGFDLYSKERKSISDEYDQTRRGIVLRMGKSLAEYWQGKIAYKIENVNIKNVKDTASNLIKEEEGKKHVSSITLEIIRDTRNSYVLPSSGSKIDFSTELAGLGGDVYFSKNILSGSYYFPGFWEEHIISLWGEVGVVKPYGKSDRVPIFDRFFLGGANTVRGFKYREVGPRDDQDEPIGGEFSLVSSLEYTFPLFSHVRGALFFDIGNVYKETSDIELGELSGAVGPGLRIDLPIGPIKLDYGFVVITDKNTKGEKGRFSFSMGYVN